MRINLKNLLRSVAYAYIIYVPSNVLAQEQTNTADLISLIRSNQGLFDRVSDAGVHDSEEGVHYRKQVLSKALVYGDEMYVLTFELPQEVSTRSSVKTVGGDLELIVISSGNSPYPMSNVTLVDPDQDGFPEVGQDENSQRAAPKSREEQNRLISEYRRILYLFKVQIERLIKVIKQ